MSDFTAIAAVTGTPEALLERELPGLVFEVSKSLDVCVYACVPSHRPNDGTTLSGWPACAADGAPGVGIAAKDRGR